MIALFVLTDPNDAGAATLRALERAIGVVGNRMAIVVRHEDEILAAEISALAVTAQASCFTKCRKNSVICDREFIHVGALNEADAIPRGAFTASAHDVVEATRAKGAAAIFVGPIYDVPRKGPARGVALLRDVRVALPHNKLYALGGIDESNVAVCIRAGADGVAVIRAVIHAKDPGAAAREIVRAVDAARAVSALRDRYTTILRSDRDLHRTARKKPRRTS